MVLVESHQKKHMFFCKVEGDPKPSVSWYKDNAPIPNNNRYNVVNRGLRLSPVLVSDGGTFYCEAENSEGKIRSKEVVLEVQGTWVTSYGGIINVIVLNNRSIILTLQTLTMH